MNQDDGHMCGPLATTAIAYVLRGIRPSASAIGASRSILTLAEKKFLRDWYATLILGTVREYHLSARVSESWLDDSVTGAMSSWFSLHGLGRSRRSRRG